MRRFLVLIVLLIVVCAACTAPPTPAVPMRLLAVWQPQQDTLTTQDAARGWRFAGQTGDAINLRLDAKANGQATLTLQDENGQTLAQGDDLRLTLPASGVYTALVQLVAGANTTYSLTLSYTDRSAPTASPTASDTPTNTLTPTATYTPSDTPTVTSTPTPVYAALGTLSGQLQVGQTLTGTYLSSFERHIYLFSGSSGQVVTLTMVGTSGTVDPVLNLFDPTGQAVATDDDSGGGTSALLRNIRLPLAGTYIVQALGGGTGDYQISLASTAPTPTDDQPTSTPTPPLGTATPAAAAAELQDHVSVLDSINRPGDFRRYFMSVQSGDVLTIGVRPVAGSALQPRLEVYTPEGELLTSASLDSSSGEALIPSMGVVETGKYGVFVSDDNNSTGAYMLAYGRGDTNIDDEHGGVAAGTLAPGGGEQLARDEWRLPLNSGDVIDVEADGAALQVVAPDGSNAGGALNTVEISAALSGDYHVFATGAAYRLLWHYRRTAPTLSAPQLILSAKNSVPADNYLVYPFQGAAGEQVHIRVEALTAGLDPVAALLDPTGKQIAQGDDSHNSLDPDFAAQLPVDGTYKLRVNAYGGSVGSVNVTVEMLS